MAAGRKLAQEQAEPLKVVHILGDSSADWKLSAVATNWLRFHDVDPTELEVRRGVAWVELVRASEEWGAHLVVAGTHGSTGFQPFRLGNTASMLALRSRTPVVLAPAHRAGNNPKETR